MKSYFLNLKTSFTSKKGIHSSVLSVAFFILVISFNNCSGGFEVATNSTSNPSLSGVAPSQVEVGKAMYETKCASCHGSILTSTKIGRNASQISTALASISEMAALKSVLSPDDTAAIALALAPPATQGRAKYVCDEKVLPPNAIQRLSNRSYIASLTAILSEISPQIINDASLQSFFSQLPTDIIGGRENTFVISSNLIGLQNDIAFRIGSLIGSNPTYLNALPGTNACLSATTVTATCVNNFIRNFGRRTYRRPVTAAELASLNLLYSGLSSTVADKVTVVIAALLQAPDFMYEIYDGGTATSTNRMSLNAFEYASKLSLLLTGTGPDAALRAVADNGTILTDSNVTSQQIDRLLSTELGKTTVLRFYREWLQYDKFDSFQFPTDVANGLNTTSLKEDVVAEIENFLTDTTLNGQTFSDLMTSTQTRFNSETLATVYGVSNPLGASTNLNSTQRAGLLTRAAFLTKRSGSTTSPIVRGKFVLTNMLCSTVGAPPANAPSVIAPLPAGTYYTTRERVANQTEQNGTACIACHSRMNNLGYQFESYDNLGRYRSTERIFDSIGLYLNKDLTVSTFTTTSELAANAISTQDGVALSRELANNDKALTCMAQKWQEFQVRRAATAQDNCAMNDTLTTLYGTGNSQGSIRDMMKKSILSTSFKERTY